MQNSEYNQSGSSPDTGWHLDKKVPISIIAVLLGYGITGIWFVADIKRDVEILKAAQSVQRERDARQDVNHDESLSLLRNDMRDINGKLDRLIERAIGNGIHPAPTQSARH